jgi:L-aspartate oxidase
MAGAPGVATRLAPSSSDCGDADVVVVGTGAAGMSAALHAAKSGLTVLLVTKGPLGSGATAWAQGGLAAVLSPSDSPTAHIEDTLVAGAGLCDRDVVRSVVAAAPGAIDSLLALGATFDRTRTGALDLALEGGHGVPRIAHAGGDASGAEVVRVLSGAVRAAVDSGRIGLAEHTLALDARLDVTGRVDGLVMLAGGRVRTIGCRALVLATGGLGQAFAATTNPPGATGDGVALALRAGAVVTDLEFVQFHPTMLVPPGGRRPGDRGVLVSEAVRGEGALLRDLSGGPVMAGVHPLGDLAPRDVVSAAMHARMRDSGDAYLLLDGTALGRATWERRFPTILQLCRARGVDPVNEPVPVSPAAHYSCGGVRAALDGSTSVPGLYAVGEVAATGLHGANRLASNSVPEALVAGELAGRRLVGDLVTPTSPASHAQEGRPVLLVDPMTRDASARAMSALAGVHRRPQDLARLLEHLEATSPRPGVALTPAAVEATNLHTVSVLVATAATARTESRGCHRREDVPDSDAAWVRHVDLTLGPRAATAVSTVETLTEAAA